MSWRIEVKPTAEKQYLKLDKTAKLRIQSALLELEQAENPLLQPCREKLDGQIEGGLSLTSRRLESTFYPG